MKWIKYGLWTLFAAIVFYYLVILGGPIRNLLELRGCAAGYTHYLTNNAYCNWRTSGHCATSDLNRTNARVALAQCLCDNAPQNKLEARELLELIQSDPLLRKALTRLEDRLGRPLDSVRTICDYREALFVTVALK